MMLKVIRVRDASTTTTIIKGKRHPKFSLHYKEKQKECQIYTITKIPSRWVGSSSSFLKVSSPLVTLPNIAYWKDKQMRLCMLSCHIRFWNNHLQLCSGSVTRLTCPSRWGASPRSIENEDPPLSGSECLQQSKTWCQINT